MLRLVMNGSKIVEYPDAYFCESHIVPQLLSMFRTKMFYCFTFYEDLIVYKKVHIMFVADTLTVEINGEIILLHKWFYIILFENDS